MSKTTIIPTTPEFLRETLIVLGGAILAAMVLSQLPMVRAYIQRNMGGAAGLGNVGCDCENR